MMPFIAALGYDAFDPAEVVPEFIADVGIKKAKKLILPSNMTALANSSTPLRCWLAML